MATWQGQGSSMVKFEGSPTEPLLSPPTDMYTSLFSPASSGTLNPSDILTPRASPDVSHLVAAQAGTTTTAPATTSGSPAPVTTIPAATTTPATDSTTEKKPPKKRKSWGQVLPEPKTNLPPRYVDSIQRLFTRRAPLT